jgi:peroxiredoxin
MPVHASNRNFGWNAKEFKLKSINEKIYKLGDLKGQKGTVIVFICNHCPYVKAIADRLAFESKELFKININTIAIMSNDVEKYPEDSFENMKNFSKLHNFEFPYLYDEYQKVAKGYNAVCTPDFFGFNKFLELQYRGRIDSGVIQTNEDEVKRELYEAMMQISKTNKGPIKQYNSIGCSIKWKND